MSAVAAGQDNAAGATASLRAAFTFLELLMVMAIIGVLASITIVIGRGVHERSQVAQAKAELAALAAALESYKAHYGDYPWTPGESPDGGAILYNALNGNIGPNSTVLAQKGRVFVDLSRFTLDNDELPDPTTAEFSNNWFNDPWGTWYWYKYKSGPADSTWRSPGYLLYSHGPDTRCDLGPAAETGLLGDLPTQEIDPESFEENADNLYAGRP